MSWLFSRVLAAEYSAAICSNGEPSAPLSETPTPQAYLSRDKTTDAWRRFPSGMTCEPLTGDRGEELLMSYLAGFHARTSAAPEKARASRASGQDSGVKCRGSLARYDRDSRSWKTPQCWLFADLDESLGTWPKWGMTRDGVAYPQPTPSLLLEIRQRITAANESGSRLPTPRSQEPGRTSEGYGRGLAELVEGHAQLRKIGTPTATSGIPSAGWRSGPITPREVAKAIGGKLNPQWVEWLMGWPIGWTDLEPLAMVKFRTWRS
jgi:hypothetical protein